MTRSSLFVVEFWFLILETVSSFASGGFLIGVLQCVSGVAKWIPK